MSIEDFLEKYIEGYLFEDLSGMDSLNPKRSGKDHGAAGYPMIMSIFSGMEILGFLFSKKKQGEYRPTDGQDYFCEFWKEYFVKKPVYKNRGTFFYKLFRHGLAHTGMSKIGTVVMKQTRTETSIDFENQTVLLDASMFLSEFKEAYFVAKERMIREFAQNNLKKLVGYTKEDSENLFTKFCNDCPKKQLPTSMTNASVPFKDNTNYGYVSGDMSHPHYRDLF